MKSLQEYHIPFTGLKEGKHQFEFDIDQRFFNEFEYSLVKNGQLKVELELDKQETMLILQFVIKGSIFLNCDICLSDFPTVVDSREQQIVKFSDDENLEHDTDEIIILGKNEHEVDVSTLIYEYINLAVPYFHRCDDQGNTQWCDKEMVEKLSKLSGNQKDEEEENTAADPRWDALKNIKNN
ncbi:YceD family protein [Desertivirga xinjiangensis]|uniref:YceD family protein n=1 Tax=Desertivirga xinjiangensis TaxID=539206 RepID=UPI00210D8294|nr:DUF177 domain-containing protein [Pedobacter xinjiangensis]